MIQAADCVVKMGACPLPEPMLGLFREYPAAAKMLTEASFSHGSSGSNAESKSVTS